MTQDILKRLKKDHGLIRTGAQLLNRFCEELEAQSNLPLEDMMMLLDFFERFAEGIHHTREEQGLFIHLLRYRDFLDKDILELLQGHDHSLDQIQILKDYYILLNEGKEKMRGFFIENSQTYLQELDEHMSREENFIFPYADLFLKDRNDSLPFLKLDSQFYSEVIFQLHHKWNPH